MLRSALLILSGNATASLLSLARNLIVARMIPVADYGVAATFAVVISVVEMVSTFGLQQQIVQAKDGDDPRFQAGLQGFQLLRGIASGALLFALAGPFAAFMNLPEVAWAYRVMALVPVLNALAHFDLHRFSRRMRFGPMLLARTLPPFLALLAVWPLAIWFGDWRVMLCSILLQTGAAAAASHLVAERPYRAILDRAILDRSLRFGWPLMLNNVLLFAVFQGDKVIVGRELGPGTLALFAMGVTLTLTPTLVMAASLQTFFLPLLSAAQGDVARFRRLAAATMQAALLAGAAFVTLVTLAGAPVVHLLLGDKYLALLPLLTWFAILQVVRMFKVGPAIVALAAGATGNAMVSNAVRLLSLPFAWHVATTSGNLLHVVWIATLGEIAGLAVALALLAGRTGIGLGPALLPHAAAAAVLLAAGAYALGPGAEGGALAPLWLWGSFTLLLGLAAAAMPDLRRALLRRRR